MTYGWYPLCGVPGTNPAIGYTTVCPMNRPWQLHRIAHDNGQHLDVKRTFWLNEWIAWDPADTTFGDFSGASTASVYVPQIAAEMAAPGWLRYHDLPVLMLYLDAEFDTLTPGAGYVTAWNAVRAGLPTFYLICMGATASPILTQWGCNANVMYGPDGGTLAPVGQHPYSDQVTEDHGAWGTSGGRDLAYTITLGGDQRPRRQDYTGSTTAWADSPTAWQLINHVGAANRGAPMVIYAVTEPTEGTSHFWGTDQKPTLYTDAMRLALTRPSDRPSTFTDMLNAGSKEFAQSGTVTWSRTELAGLGILPAYDSDTYWLTAATDALTGTFANTTRIRHYGPKGSAVGNCTYTVDGGTPVVVDGNNVSTSQVQLLFDSGALTEGSHTLVIAGHAANAGASRRCGANKVELDRNPQSLSAWLH